MSHDSTVRTIRLEADLDRQLCELARLNERTVVGEIRRAIRQYLEREKGHEAAAA